MIRVLIVDDSAVVRAALSSIFEQASDIEVVGSAADPYIARNKFKRLEPDVITLDVEMPRMDGLTFLDKLMHYRPVPVVMISSLTKKGADTTLRALSLGAVDFVAKPTSIYADGLAELGTEIIEKVRSAAGASVKPSLNGPGQRRPGRQKGASTLARLEVEQRVNIDEVLARRLGRVRGGEAVICIGASTGGTQAIEQLFGSLGADLPGIVVVQHMPKAFTGAFANRLDGQCALEVAEATDRMPIRPGRAIIAPGDRHLLLQRSGGGYRIELRDGPRVSRHKPSVDVLFRSAANSAGARAVGVILTGMGDDGSRGLKDMYDAGCFTVAQDEASCVVFGMPKMAIERGGVSKVAPLSHIPTILGKVGNARKGAA